MASALDLRPICPLPEKNRDRAQLQLKSDLPVQKARFSLELEPLLPYLQLSDRARPLPSRKSTTISITNLGKLKIASRGNGGMVNYE
ncbi:hypothetical protein [Oscillatoria sp. FACHB-1406]|uniref:hypothetical protein n=1 Tax=Oscillatoria sp. FACHB-1406 TaxID=2692846 RepID=UPI001686EB86|nr:hypothetical protein [Oscillatoria sp. FACHB-1406]MBD2579626.1 hypothetical protein [Oscillatoria sp. FACHB-1406]